MGCEAFGNLVYIKLFSYPYMQPLWSLKNEKLEEDVFLSSSCRKICLSLFVHSYVAEGCVGEHIKIQD